MLKSRTIDVRKAVSRTVVYGLTLALLGTIYVMLTSLTTSWLAHKSILPKEVSFGDANVVNVVATLGLVFLFQPIRRFFDTITHQIFYRNRYRRDAFYADLNDILTATTNLRSLLERISKLFVETFNSSHAFFFVYRDDRYVMAGNGDYSRLPVKDARWLEEVVVQRPPEDIPVFLSDLGSTDEETKLRRFMVSHKLEVIVPLEQAGTTLGYVGMGARRGRLYEPRDRSVLRTVSDELVIAIQNALSIQEVRDLNETLQQRIDDATKELRSSNAQLLKLDQAKDDFISMASHQLRTPLTSIKGYIDMMLDGDAGKITPTQKQFLTEAFASSERMVHLINDFLNISRLQTGRFAIEKRPADLVKIVEQELESLRVSASGRNLTFEFVADKGLPKLLLDEAKIRQVIMNFSDNAMYYSRPDTTIAVSLHHEDGDVVFRVKDTGIGVPKEEQSRLFTKFFRATNARRQRPDGTGIGLYLAKRIITGHGGEIVFSSTEGEGSTFGFRLSLKRLGVRDDAN